VVEKIDTMDAAWTPSSWKSKPILQQPVYENQDHLNSALAKIRALPPLVHPKEVSRLKESLAKAGRGELFLLQVTIILACLTTNHQREEIVRKDLLIVTKTQLKQNSRFFYRCL